MVTSKQADGHVHKAAIYSFRLPASGRCCPCLGMTHGQIIMTMTGMLLSCHGLQHVTQMHCANAFVSRPIMLTPSASVHQRCGTVSALHGSGCCLSQPNNADDCHWSMSAPARLPGCHLPTIHCTLQLYRSSTVATSWPSAAAAACVMLCKPHLHHMPASREAGREAGRCHCG